MPRSTWSRKTLLLLLTPFLTLTAATAAPAPVPQAATGAPAVSLKAGDMAPAFVPGTWLKGEPIPGLAKGKVYVLEFWATWCGACKAAMPHVSELARKHAGKITFIGVNVQETGKSCEEKDARAAEFVKASGEQMAYAVCRDTADEAINRNWLTAAGIQGIPSTFIIDKTGRIVWIGHPSSMDAVVEELAAGTFNYEARQALEAANKKVEAAINQAFEAKDYKKVMELLPDFKPDTDTGRLWAGFYRFQALLHLDLKAADARYLEVLKEGPLLHAEFYSNIVLRTEGLPKEWYLRTIPVYQKRLKEEPAVIVYLGKAQFLSGQYKAAAKSKAQELKQLKAQIPAILKDHPEAGDLVKKEVAKVEAALKQYQALAAKQK